MAPSNVEHLENNIKNFIDQKSGFGNESRKIRIIEKLFREFDRNGSGEVDEEEFLAALVKMNIVGCTETALELFDRYDQDMSGLISYQEFARALFEGDNGVDRLSDSTIRAKRDAQDIVSRVKGRILRLAGKNAGIRSVTRILRQMDSDGSNSLSASELREGLVTYGIRTTTSEIQTLMRFFDRDNSGRITIEEFLRGLRGEMNRSRRKLVRAAWEQLVRHLELDGPDDSVSLHELASFYDVSKNPEVIEGRLTPEEAMRQFMANWDKNHDDVVEWKEFLDYYKDLSAGIDNDDYFELMIRNAWHLSGGTGWSENTSNIRCLVTFYDGRQKVVELVDDFGVSRGASERELIQLLEKQGIKNIESVSLSN